MRAITVAKYGEVDDVLKMSEDVPIPKVEAGSGNVLIKVRACSITPGDVRRIRGEVAGVMGPPGGFPFIPGLDVSGVVEEIDPEISNESIKFRVGDEVVGTWAAFGVGGLAEYALVNSTLIVKRPDNVTPLEGSALANSACHALLCLRQANIKKGDRVLVLGGGGGIGTAMVQLLRSMEASYVACTTTNVCLLEELGVDRAINYKQENWWEIEEFKKRKFDVIIDCAEGKIAWGRAKGGVVLKNKRNGGRFVAVVPQNWFIDGSKAYKMIAWIGPVLGRVMANKMSLRAPKYSWVANSITGDVMQEIMDMAAKGELKVPFDPASPHPFTEEGTKDAFNLLYSRRGKGKIVIAIDPTAK